MLPTGEEASLGQTTPSGPDVVGVVSAVPVADDTSLLLGALEARPSIKYTSNN